MASTSSLAPISLASTIIGFVSFGFTILIWIHAFWSGFQTIGSAPTQVRDTLSTLRQGLYEEREYLRRLKRRKLPSSEKGGVEGALYFEGGPVRIISDAVKDLIRDFKRLEAPFLVPPREGRERELEWSFDATQHYYRCDFGHRVLWLRNKNAVVDVSNRLTIIQIRRVAVELAECHVMLGDVESMVRRSGDRLTAIEERLRMSQIG